MQNRPGQPESMAQRTHTAAGHPRLPSGRRRFFSEAIMPPHKAKPVALYGVRPLQMRACHLTLMTLCICFFAWFAAAPLLPAFKGEFPLSKGRIAYIVVAALGVMVLVRMAAGSACHRYGARIACTTLLGLGSIPVIGFAFAQSYESFFFLRLAVGAIGASLAITQYQKSAQFAPNMAGAANPTVRAGNAVDGVILTIVPPILASLLSLGVQHTLGWRTALFVPGASMPVVAFLCWRFAQEMPAGSVLFGQDQVGRGHRICMLAASYGAGFCVGIIGAGGGLLLKPSNPPGTLFDFGLVILACSLCAVAVRFSPAHRQGEPFLHGQAVAQRQAQRPTGAVA